MFENLYKKLIKLNACMLPPASNTGNSVAHVDVKMVYRLLVVWIFLVSMIGLSKIFETGLYSFLSNCIVLMGSTIIAYIIILTHTPRVDMQ